MTAVEEPIDCPNVSSIACKYASMFQEFLQNSGLPVWNRFKNTGFWRQLTVGINDFKCTMHAKDFMINVVASLLPSGLGRDE